MLLCNRPIGGEVDMSISNKIRDSLERASWIRKMFEEGAKRRAEFGAESVFDFSLGNPNLEPPARLKETLKELANYFIQEHREQVIKKLGINARTETSDSKMDDASELVSLTTRSRFMAPQGYSTPEATSDNLNLAKASPENEEKTIPPNSNRRIPS